MTTLYLTMCRAPNNVTTNTYGSQCAVANRVNVSIEVDETTPVVSTVQTFDSPFALETNEGALVSAAILLVWAAGWAIRQIRRAMDSASGLDPSDRT